MAKVIVIEDEADLRRLLVDELEDAGHETLEAGDGVDGLTTILAESPDVIVSDIGMPRMDGYQLKERLGDLPHHKATPFLFLSALAFEQAIDKGMEVGADHLPHQTGRLRYLVVSHRGMRCLIAPEGPRL